MFLSLRLLRSGNHWYIATRKEELSEEEIARRAAAVGKSA
jgi:hypothetical protein